MLLKSEFITFTPLFLRCWAARLDQSLSPLGLGIMLFVLRYCWFWFLEGEVLMVALS